jgi:hypothetical protein
VQQKKEVKRVFFSKSAREMKNVDFEKKTLLCKEKILVLFKNMKSLIKNLKKKLYTIELFI